MQLEIFQQPILHRKENSASNERILKDNAARLSANCEKILTELKRGVKLTGMDCIYKLGMSEYRRRFKDLIDAGYPIKSEMIGGQKVWWMEK